MTADYIPVQMIEEAREKRAFSAAQLVVQSSTFSMTYSTGQHLNQAPVTPGSLFDIASLTKLLSTTALTAQAIAGRDLSLNTKVRDVLPNFKGHAETTVEDLLAHRSGLPPWRPLYRTALERDHGVFAPDRPSQAPRLGDAFREARICTIADTLQIQPNHPIGVRQYSDIGFIILAELLEHALSSPLNQLFQQFAGPIGLSQTSYQDLTTEIDAPAKAFVVTGSQRPRPAVEGIKAHHIAGQTNTRTAPGEVDDDNAYALGGVAGHAGLFSTAQDVAAFGTWLISTLSQDSLIGQVWRKFIIADQTAVGPSRGLGVDLPSPTGSSIGTKLGATGPKGAIGHLGFTGCSLWIDLDRQASVALLTNRVWCDRHANPTFRALRPALHDAVADLIDAPSSEMAR
jgi:CubicO group peptidase (beta-lactamase class C family)